MITIESTASCGQSPRLLMLLEEVGEPYELVVRPDDYFFKLDGRPGPRVHDGDLTLSHARAALCHIARTRSDLLGTDPATRAQVDEWLDEAWFGLGIFAMFLARAKQTGEDVTMAQAPVLAALRNLEAALEDQQFLLGTFTAADVALGNLARVGELVDLAPFPNIRRYAAALELRPAYQRATRRLRGVVQPQEVLDYWFDAPITNEAELRASLRRWFMGGESMDAEIRERFTATTEAALAGELADWAETPEGLVALIIALDQFPRHIFRGTARAYDGETLAVPLSIRAGETDVLDALPIPQRVFASMPCRHAEDLDLIARHGEMLRHLGASASPLMQMLIVGGLEQVTKFADVLRRFGRYPTRNADLGRESTPEELEFIASFSAAAPPQIVREMLSNDAPR